MRTSRYFWERRRLLHERTGEALEALYASNLKEQFSELAYHFSRSGNSPKALDYLALAGEQAAARSAFSEAANHLNRALRLLPALSDQAERVQKELRLQLALGSVLVVTAGWGAPERTRTLERARELCEQTGESEEMFRVLWHMCQVCTAGSRMAEAQDLANESMHIAERSSNSTLKLLAHMNLCEINLRLGNFGMAYNHAVSVLESYKPVDHGSLAIGYIVDVRVMASYWLGLIDLYCGRLDTAVRVARTNVEFARTLSHPYSLVLALSAAALTHVGRGEGQAAVTRAEEAFSLCIEHGFTDFVGFVRSILGDAHAAAGRLEEGIAEIVQSLAELKATGWDYPSFVLEQLARAYLAAGKPNQALHTAEEGLQMIARTGEFAFRPPLFAWKAQALISLGETERALHWLRAAIDLAHEQGAKLVELGATSLQASVLASQDQHEQGRKMLAKVYSCFTEGFETVYLKAAKALLDELRV